MEHFYLGLSFHYAVDIIGFSACGATLATFAQTRMWPMRIFAIAANILFIGYGALGLLYPVLFLHLVLLPLNVARLVQLASQDGVRLTADREPAQRIPGPHAPEKISTYPPFSGRREPASAGSLSARSAVWDFIRPAPP